MGEPNMKNEIRWLALVAGFIAAVAGSLGCATMAATSAANDHSEFYNKPVSRDDIVAIRRPAPDATPPGQPDAVAFVGLQNTYVLPKGGYELARIAQLKLDGGRVNVDPRRKLYLKDKKVWGNLVFNFYGGADVSAADQGQLERAGFSKRENGPYIRYEKEVAIEGMVYPPMTLSDDQMSKLPARQSIDLYNPPDAKPPTNVGATLMIPVAVVADIVLIPVYLVAGVAVLLSSR